MSNPKVPKRALVRIEKPFKSYSVMFEEMAFVLPGIGVAFKTPVGKLAQQYTTEQRDDAWALEAYQALRGQYGAEDYKAFLTEEGESASIATLKIEKGLVVISTFGLICFGWKRSGDVYDAFIEAFAGGQFKADALAEALGGVLQWSPVFETSQFPLERVLSYEEMGEVMKKRLVFEAENAADNKPGVPPEGGEGGVTEAGA